jgi:hypothetical protein
MRDGASAKKERLIFYSCKLSKQHLMFIIKKWICIAAFPNRRRLAHG